MAAGDYIRIKLTFIPTPVDNPRCVWYLINTKQCHTISDLCCSVKKRYFQDFVGELELSMDEAHLPLYENIRLFKDGDEVKVEWRKNKRKISSDSKSFGSAKKKKKTVINVAQPSSNAISLSPLNKVMETKKCTQKETIRSTASGNALYHHGSPKNVSSKSMESMQSPAFSRGDNKGTSSGWDVTPDKLHVKTFVSKTGGVHKRFSSCSSSSSVTSTSSSSESETEPGVALHTANELEKQNVREVKLGPPKVNKSISLAPVPTPVRGRGRGIPVIPVGRGRGRFQNGKPTLGKITGGQSDQLKVLSTVINVLPSDINVVQVSGDEVTAKDYNSYQTLQGPPRVGDVIAFKTVEMSPQYTPELSDFKEATVLDVNLSNKSIKLQLSEATLQQEKNRAMKLSSGKFSIEEPQIPFVESEVELNLDSIRDVKLL